MTIARASPTTSSAVIFAPRFVVTVAHQSVACDNPQGGEREEPGNRQDEDEVGHAPIPHLVCLYGKAS